MAYLDRNLAAYRGSLELPVDLTGLGLAAPAGGLTPLERSVVRLSLRDARSSLSAGPRWLAAARRVFGVTAANALADPRLEALRRFAVLLRLRGESAQADYDAFLAAGFEPLHANQVAAMVGGAGRRSRRDGIGAAGWLASLGAAGGLFAASVSYVGDPLVGVVASALGFVTVAPMMGRSGR